MSDKFVPDSAEGFVLDDTPKAFAKRRAKELGIPWDVANAHITVESNWNPNAKSMGGVLGGTYEPPSSATGLMQLINSTAKRYGVEDPKDPYQNIDGGLRYLKDLHGQFGTWTGASQAYKQGEGSLAKNGPNSVTKAHLLKLSKLSETLVGEQFVPDSGEPQFVPDEKFVPDEEGLGKRLARATGAVTGIAADFAPYFAGIGGLMSQALPGLAGGAVTAYELAEGNTWTYSAHQGYEVMDRIAGWTTPSRLAVEKLGVPEDLVHNENAEALNKVLMYVPEKFGEAAKIKGAGEPIEAVSGAVGEFLGNAVLFHAVGGAKTVGIDLSVGKYKYSDLTPFNIFKSNTQAGQLASYTNNFGASREGNIPAKDFISQQHLPSLPSEAREFVSNLLQSDKPLPSMELQNILLRDPKKWTVDDKLTIMSWDKELSALKRNGGQYDPTTGYKQIPKISDGQLFWSMNPVRPVFDQNVLKESLDLVRTKPFSLDTETLPTKWVWAMRGEDRAVAPKASGAATMRSVEKHGITEPLEITYSLTDNSFVLNKGNTKVATAMRENIPEVPVYVRIVADHDPAFASGAISADAFGINQNVLANNIARKQTVTPTAAGLPGRSLIDAAKDPLGANTNVSQGYWWSNTQVAGEVVKKAREQALGFNVERIVSLTTPKTWQEFRNMIDPKEVKEISSNQHTMYGKVFTPEQAGEMSRNPVINWVASIISDVKKSSDLLSDTWKFGTSIKRKAQAFGLRTTMKAERDPNAWVTSYKNLSQKEATRLREQDLIWSKAKFDATPADMQAAGFTPKMIQAFEAKQRFNSEILKALNEAHAELGLPLIERLPGYTTSVRKGDFYVEAKDAKGNTLFRQQVRSTGKLLGINTRQWGASAVEKEVKKLFPGATVSVGEVSRGPGNPFAVSVLQLDSLNNFVSEMGAQRLKDSGINPNVVFDIEALIEQRQRSAGAGGHKNQKQFVPGAKGDELLKSDKAKNNSYREAQELYANEIANYISNRKLDKTLDAAIRDPMLADKPELLSLIQEMKDHGKGAYDINGNDRGFNVLLDGPVKALIGAGRSEVYGGIEAVNRAAYFAWLHLKPGFAVSQIVQPVQFLPPELAHWQAYGMKGNITVATLKGAGDIIHPSEGFLKYLEHGVKTQTLDPQLIRKMGIRLGGLTEKPGFNYLLGEKIQAGLEKGGRLGAAATAYNFFKDSGIKDTAQLHYLTDQVVNNVMVDFHRTAAPAMYRGGNYITQAAGVLSRYHHNYVAQFSKYWNTMRETGNAKPIALFLGMQAFSAGLIGFFGVKDADWIIEKLRAGEVIDATFPTISEYLVKHVPDLPTYGVPSVLTGLFMQKPVNVSGSLGAPSNIPGVSSLFPSLQWGGKILASSWDVMSPFKQHTVNDVLKWAGDMVPGFMKHPTQEYISQTLKNKPFAEAGKPLPDLNQRGVGGVRVDEGDLQAKWLNMKTIDESRKQTIVSSSRATEGAQKDRQYVLIGQLAAGFQGEKQINIAPIFKELLEYGMTPKQATQSAIELIKKQHMDSSQRFIGANPKTLNAFQKYKLLKGEGLLDE